MPDKFGKVKSRFLHQAQPDLFQESSPPIDMAVLNCRVQWTKLEEENSVYDAFNDFADINPGCHGWGDRCQSCAVPASAMVITGWPGSVRILPQSQARQTPKPGHRSFGLDGYCTDSFRLAPVPSQRKKATAVHYVYHVSRQ